MKFPNPIMEKPKTDFKKKRKTKEKKSVDPHKLYYAEPLHLILLMKTSVSVMCKTRLANRIGTSNDSYW